MRRTKGGRNRCKASATSADSSPARALSRIPMEANLGNAFSIRRAAIVATAAMMLSVTSACANEGVALPVPQKDIPASKALATDTAVFAGGCFWGVEAVFRHVRGVKSSVSGYAGGEAATAHYEIVGSGATGHAESVQVTYDPSQVSYGELLRIFFSVAHDPTQLNRQGPDVGTQYRSAIFTRNDAQMEVAKAYIAQLDAAKVYKRPIVTQVTSLPGFYRAEDYHQNYYDKHSSDGYCRLVIAPKLEKLHKLHPNQLKAAM